VKVQSKDRRVQKFLDRHMRKAAFKWADITDPRARRGRRWKLSELINAAFCGLLGACATLRDVEGMTDELGQVGRQYVPRRVPDTTLWQFLSRLDPSEFRVQLRQQIKALWRAKSLDPVGLPCGAVAVDGKGMGALEHDAEGDAQKNERGDGSPYWLSRMLRAALISAASTPCIDQMPIGAKTNEMASFIPFFDGLVTAYGAMFEIVTADAGMTSRGNADHVHAANKAYVMALKDNQPELFAEAKRLLLPLAKATPAASSLWEVYRGKLVQRRLFRTQEIAGYHDWTHLQQAWLVETWQRDDRDSDPKLVEQRFFLTSATVGKLTPDQILILVRGHWGIENDCFWTFDLQWKEDSVPWCSSGKAVETLGLLRMMAYNLLQLARRRHLRLKADDGSLDDPPAWRRLFEWVKQALRLSLDTSLPQTAAG